MFVPYALETENERRPWATEAMLAANAAVGLAVMFLAPETREWIFTRWGFKAFDPSPVEAITSMFLHANWLHLAANMVFLWIFGRGLERTIGPVKWLVVYFVGGAAAVALHALGVSESLSDVSAVGASGAISGVVGAVAIALPSAPVQCVYLSPGSWAPVRIAVPSGIFAVSWFFLQVFLAVFFGSFLLGVAFWAHIGGFAAGALLGLAFEGVPRLRRRRRQEAASRALAREFEAFRENGRARDVSLDAGDATADERHVGGMMAGKPPEDEGAAAASAFLGPMRTNWNGKHYVRAIDALSQLGLHREAVGAAAEFFETREGDSAEPEVLRQAAHALTRRLKRPDLGGLAARALVERHPKSMQAREVRRESAGPEK